MTSSSGIGARVPSKGWRSVWIGRLVMLPGAAIGVAGTWWLASGPARSAALGYLVFIFAFLVLMAIALESVRPRAVRISPSGVTIEYLFSKTKLPWENVRKSAGPPISWTKEVAYDQIPPEGIGGRGSHCLTQEQSEAIERYRRARSAQDPGPIT